jgi:hypothetical protein
MNFFKSIWKRENKEQEKALLAYGFAFLWMLFFGRLGGRWMNDLFVLDQSFWTVFSWSIVFFLGLLILEWQIWVWPDAGGGFFLKAFFFFLRVVRGLFIAIPFFLFLPVLARAEFGMNAMFAVMIFWALLMGVYLFRPHVHVIRKSPWSFSLREGGFKIFSGFLAQAFYQFMAFFFLLFYVRLLNLESVSFWTDFSWPQGASLLVVTALVYLSLCPFVLFHNAAVSERGELVMREHAGWHFFLFLVGMVAVMLMV